MQKLVSVIIASYRKFQFIYEAIDSVLCQTYGAIELIISDDGSENFPETELGEYIEANKRDNVRSVLLHHEDENQGTVKHLNHALWLAHGEYIGLMAADDAYFDENALERFVAGFENLDGNEPCYLEMAQTAMCGHSLKKIDSYALFQNVREAVEEGGNRLFELVAYSACLPTTSFFYKKEFFEKFGYFDEDFVLVEDYPMHCRAAREGWKIHYENFAAARHRSGGISHGNVGGLSRSAYLYSLDILKVREKYLEPYYGMLGKEVLEEVRDRTWEECKRICSQLPLYENSRKLRRQYIQRYWRSICKDKLCASWWGLRSFAAEMFQTVLLLIIVIPEAEVLFQHKIGREVLEGVMEAVYKFGWALFSVGGICWLGGWLGKKILQIEAFPWEVSRF